MESECHRLFCDEGIGYALRTRTDRPVRSCGYIHQIVFTCEWVIGHACARDRWNYDFCWFQRFLTICDHASIARWKHRMNHACFISGFDLRFSGVDLLSQATVATGIVPGWYACGVLVACNCEEHTHEITQKFRGKFADSPCTLTVEGLYLLRDW